MKVNVFKKGREKPYFVIKDAISLKENAASYTIFTKKGKQIYSKPEHECKEEQ